MHFACQSGIRRVALAEKENFQPVEMLWVAVMHKLASKSLHDSVEHRERPAPFADALRCFIVRRLALLLRDRWADRLKKSINDTMAVFTGILFQWRSPISKKRKRNWGDVRN